MTIGSIFLCSCEAVVPNTVILYLFKSTESHWLLNLSLMFVLKCYNQVATFPLCTSNQSMKQLSSSFLSTTRTKKYLVRTAVQKQQRRTAWDTGKKSQLGPCTKRKCPFVTTFPKRTPLVVCFSLHSMFSYNSALLVDNSETLFNEKLLSKS